MSEEEIIKIIKYMLENRNTDINIIINYEAIQGLLDLYTKQQKEIEELKENELLEITENFISKDKIKELKEKVEKEMISNPYDFSYMINELLEEN